MAASCLVWACVFGHVRVPGAVRWRLHRALTSAEHVVMLNMAQDALRVCVCARYWCLLTMYGILTQEKFILSLRALSQGTWCCVL